MQFEVIIPLIAYLVVVFGLSLYAMRKRASGSFLNEYFLGSRSMGGFVLAMTLTATYISASSFIGGPGAAYKYGLGWVLLAMIQLPAIWLSLGVLGKKFAILPRRYNAVSLNDMLLARYQSRLLVWLASLSLLVAFVGAMTVQFIGGARLLETAAGIPYDTGLLIFGVSIALYTAYGGFRASVLNDTMQGMVMLIGTIVLLVGVLADGRLAGVRVIGHKETPGLGDKIEVAKADWIHAFAGKALATARWAVKKDGGEFDQFAGATITPRAVVKAVKEGLAFYAAHRAEIAAPSGEQP